MIDSKKYFLDYVNDCCPSLYRAMGLAIKEQSGCLFAVSGMQASLLNAVIHCSTKNPQVEAAVERVIQYFTDRKLPHSWWVEVATEPSQLKEALEKKGLGLLGTYPGMIVNMVDMRIPKTPNNLEIEKVIDQEKFHLWSNVISEAFEFSEEVSKSYVSLYEKTISSNGPFHHLIGKKKGKVVCTGSVLCTDSGAYLYNIVTSEKERGKGFGSYISYALIQLAYSQNIFQIGLVSSPQAASTYLKLGFKEVTRYHIYA